MGKYPYNAFLRQLPSSNVAGQGQIRQSLSANQAVVLGRDPSCEIVLDATLYEGVSRRHAEVRPITGTQSQGGWPGWLLCDLNSANGTYVNGKRLHGCQTLQVGDRIRLDHNGPEFIFECQVSTPVVHAPKALPVQVSDSVHLSQLLPIFSTGRELTQKAYLVPGIFTILLVVFLFANVGNPQVFNLLLAVYLAGVGYYFVYQLCGKPKPWWLLLGSCLATMLILVSPLLPLFIFVFRQVLPGDIQQGEQVSFPSLLVSMFFGAGLMEELIKALPVLAALQLGRKLKSPWRERVGVWEPLDGILLGTASAVGFTLLETLGQYVPGIVQDVAEQAGEGAGELVGIQLLIPRILGSVAGHMSYSGYLGYFIGLAVLKPTRGWRIFGIGYLTAAALHALWNSSIVLGETVTALAGVLAYAFLMAAILKARKLSPNRSQNFATRMARPPNFP